MDSQNFKIWLKAQEDQLSSELTRCLQTREEAESTIVSLANEPIKQAFLITRVNDLDKIITGIKYKQKQLDEYPEVLAIIYALDNRRNSDKNEYETSVSTTNLEN